MLDSVPEVFKADTCVCGEVSNDITVRSKTVILIRKTLWEIPVEECNDRCNAGLQ
jgi:hypothetical protein